MNKIISKSVIILMKYKNLKIKIVLFHNLLNITHNKTKESQSAIMGAYLTVPEG